MLLGINECPENRHREGRAFLKGINKGTSTRIPENRMTF